MHILTNEQYHADTSRISKSGLDLIAKSPAHYYEKYLSPNRRPEIQTEAMVIGTATHCAVLEPDEFDKRFVTVPANAPKRPTSVQRNAKNPSADTVKAVEFWDKFAAQHAGKTVLDAGDYNDCQRMRDAVWRHPLASFFLNEGTAEQSFMFHEPESKAPCKIRPDFISASGFIVDLKTTEDASEEGFGKSAFNYRYHVQSAFYIDGHSLVAPEPSKGFIFIAVEKKAPFAVNFHYVLPDGNGNERAPYDMGREAYLRDCALYMECRRTNQWPGYPVELTALRLPAWAYKQNAFSQL